MILCFYGKLATKIVSFLMPYLMFFLFNDLGISGYEYFQKMTDHWPSYIVGIGYLLLTSIIEIPIVYLLLKEDCEKTRLLLVIVFVANVTTTVFVAVVERIICAGSW